MGTVHAECSSNRLLLNALQEKENASQAGLLFPPNALRLSVLQTESLCLCWMICSTVRIIFIRNFDSQPQPANPHLHWQSAPFVRHAELCLTYAPVPDQSRVVKHDQSLQPTEQINEINKRAFTRRLTLFILTLGSNESSSPVNAVKASRSCSLRGRHRHRCLCASIHTADLPVLVVLL